MHKYKKVARCNRLLVTAKHYKNEGGAVDVRSDEREHRNIDILKWKWPNVFKDNNRRKSENGGRTTEVVLSWNDLDVTKRPEAWPQSLDC